MGIPLGGTAKINGQNEASEKIPYQTSLFPWAAPKGIPPGDAPQRKRKKGKSKEREA